MLPKLAVMRARPTIHRTKVKPLTIREVRGDIVRKRCAEVVNVVARKVSIEITMSWATVSLDLEWKVKKLGG